MYGIVDSSDLLLPVVVCAFNGIKDLILPLMVLEAAVLNGFFLIYYWPSWQFSNHVVQTTKHGIGPCFVVMILLG